MLRSPILWTDDTRVTVLGGDVLGSSTGRFWVYIGDAQHPYSVYDFTMSRSRDGPAEFLKDYRGFLQADAYGGYDGIYLDSQGRIIEVACWAHARRKFYDARSNAPREANQILEWIRQLYDIEDRARDFTPAARQVLRQQESVPILDRIEKYLAELKERILPKSALGKAVNYARNQWAALRRYTSDGRLTIDNNVSERTLATPGYWPAELVVPGECRGGPASGGVVHDPGGSQASSPGAVGVPSGRGAAVVRGRDGPGVVAPGPLGSQPPRSMCCSTVSTSRGGKRRGRRRRGRRVARSPGRRREDRRHRDRQRLANRIGWPGSGRASRRLTLPARSDRALIPTLRSGTARKSDRGPAAPRSVRGPARLVGPCAYTPLALRHIPAACDAGSHVLMALHREAYFAAAKEIQFYRPEGRRNAIAA